MSIEHIKTGRFNTGNSALREGTEPVTKVTNRSELRSPNKRIDSLKEALGPKKMTLPSDHHLWRHTPISRPRGNTVHQRGEFGRTRPTTTGSTQRIYGMNRHSAPSANAVPGHQNSSKGDNAVGHAPNRRGTNAVPGHENRRGGPNAVGNAPNRYGGNALASDFRPRFSKPHGNRV
jgi:hypothetical protein